MTSRTPRQRFDRAVRFWALVALVAALGAVAWLWPQYGLASIHLYIAAFAGTFAVVLLGGTLMALTFLSSSTGHDEAVGQDEDGPRRR